MQQLPHCQKSFREWISDRLLQVSEDLIAEYERRHGCLASVSEGDEANHEIQHTKLSGSTPTSQFISQPEHDESHIKVNGSTPTGQIMSRSKDDDSHTKSNDSTPTSQFISQPTHNESIASHDNTFLRLLPADNRVETHVGDNCHVEDVSSEGDNRVEAYVSDDRDADYGSSEVDRCSSVASAPLMLQTDSLTTTFDPFGVCIINPKSIFYQVWSRFIAIIIIFSVMHAPMNYAFVEASDDSIWFVSMIFDVLFGLDILLTFNVAVKTNRGLLTSRKDIFIHYTKSRRFWSDVLASLPFGRFWQICGGDGQVAWALGLMRLIRFNRILILCQQLQQDTRLSLLGVVVGKFVLIILLSTHTAGCLFWAMAKSGGFDTETWVQNVDPDLPNLPLGTRYVKSLFWAVGTLKAGPASGALAPNSNREMILGILTMIVNISLQTYLVSSMAALLTTADVKIYLHRSRMAQLATFAERHSLPQGLRDTLTAYMSFKFHSDEDLDRNVLANLPDLYRQRINHTLYHNLIAHLNVFEGCEQPFLQLLHSSLSSTYYMTGQEIGEVDEAVTELHILAEGKVHMYYKGNLIERFHSGDSLREIPFMCKVTAICSCRTLAICHILGITWRSWETASMAFPEDAARAKTNLLARCIKKRNDPPVKQAYKRYASILQSHLLHQRDMAVTSLCFAAARGDTRELTKLLSGHTADCADYDQRSPLHIAASYGELEIINILVENAADLNIIDNFGRSPLLEACRSRQLAAAELLFEHGALLGFTFNRDETSEASGMSKGRKAKDGWKNLHVEGEELCAACSDPKELWYLNALLKYGADAAAGDYDARTALHVASACGNTAAVDILLSQQGIDTSPRDNFGRTPLMEALRHGHEPCARLLRARGADHGFFLIGQTEQSQSANVVQAGGELCHAAFSNNVAYLHRLTNLCGIDVDAADYDHRTALMLVSAEGHTDAAVLLVQNNADVNMTDRWGHTPITEARDHGHGELAKLLEQLSSQQKTFV